MLPENTAPIHKATERFATCARLPDTLVLTVTTRPDDTNPTASRHVNATSAITRAHEQPGTIGHDIRRLLNGCFFVICLLTRRQENTSAFQLLRKIGVNYNAAWKRKHKLTQMITGHQKLEYRVNRSILPAAIIAHHLYISRPSHLRRAVS